MCDSLDFVVTVDLLYLVVCAFWVGGMIDYDVALGSFL